MSLDEIKSNERGRAQNAFLGRINKCVNFDVVQFILRNNQLIEKGFVITEDNREEKYLEIVNSEDPELLEQLQSFLESLDRLSPYMFFFNNYIKTSKAIDAAQDEESVVSAVDDFMKIF